MVTKKHKLGSKQESVQQPTPNAVSISSQNMAAQPLAMNTNTIMAPKPMLSVPSGFGIPGQNIYNSLQSLLINYLSSHSQNSEVVAAFTGDLPVVLSEDEEGDSVAEETSLKHKVRWMLIVWMLLLSTFSKIK